MMVEYDSQEEQDFAWWLEEAEKHGMVSEIKYQPLSFILSEKVSVSEKVALKTKDKTIDRHLLNPHVYTPDFSFHIYKNKARDFFKSAKYYLHLDVFVDVKGTFNRFSGDREFSINQKWMWKSKGIYVQKVVPVELFKKTWVPEQCRFSPKKRQPVKKYIGIPTIDQFLRCQ